MLSVERQAMIAQMVRQNQMVKVTDLMHKFDVSDMTIRRDLSILEQQGLLKKVYGGAILATSTTVPDQDVQLHIRAGTSVNLKRAIARAAVKVIQPDDVIILDAGTTTLELARILPNSKELVVVTNSISITYEMVDELPSLLFAGGIVRSSTRSTVGPKTKEFFSDLRANKLFLGASSLSVTNGLMNSNLYESEIKRVMMQAVEQVIVLADSTKFQSKSYHAFGQWSEVDLFITDHRLPNDLHKHLSDQGVTVLIAEED